MARISEYKPHERGLEKVLGGLEAEIMRVAWSAGRVTVRDVYERLRSTKNLAYTTVMTVMSRLSAKGLLKREMIDGSYFYEPATTQVEFEKSVVGEVLDSLLESFSEQAVAYLVNRAGGDDDRLEALAKIVEERRREQGK